jgi:hypothetical protein
MRRLALFPALAAVLALGSARAAGAEPGDGAPPLPRRLAPIFRPGPFAAPPGARLSYFGGRVLSRVELVMVLWGDGVYAPYVTGGEKPSLEQFLGAVAGSPYVAGLAEYDTARPAQDGAPGTGQHIGPGSFGGVVRIAPRSHADQIDDAEIASELAAQLAQGTLPAPRAAADGTFETLYLVYFPAGKRITLGADESCRTFCAYHGALPWKGWSVPYAVMPDLSPGTGCDPGCGASTPFANAAQVVSHELAEAITDPDVAFAAGAGPPLAWYDPLNGEIGDLCVGEDGMVVGTDGVRWPVQRLWSNARGACVVPVAPQAPLVAAAPGLLAPAPSSAPAPAPALALALALALASPSGADGWRAPALSARPVAAMTLSRLPPSGPASGTEGFAPRTPLEEPVRSRPTRPLRVELREDNDAFGLARPVTDEFYTQGARIAVRWGLGPDPDDDELGIAIGQNIYTPSNLHTTDLAVLRSDRPYAGWLYLSAMLRSVSQSRAALRLGFDAAAGAATETEAELITGVTGRWSFASDVQHEVHAYLDRRAGMQNPGPPIPQGWPVYQLETMPTVDFSFRHQRDVLQVSAPLGDLTRAGGAALGLRLAPRVRFDVGSTLDAASVGLEARAGLVGASGAAWRPAFPFRLYAYGRADARWVVWNAFLEGPLHGGVVPQIRVEPFVRCYEAGVVLRMGSLELTAAQLWMTREFLPEPPGTPVLHDVGRFAVAWVTP